MVIQFYEDEYALRRKRGAVWGRTELARTVEAHQEHWVNQLTEIHIHGPFGLHFQFHTRLASWLLAREPARLRNYPYSKYPSGVKPGVYLGLICRRALTGVCFELLTSAHVFPRASMPKAHNPGSDTKALRVQMWVVQN